MVDQRHDLALAQDRRVERLPVTLLETASRSSKGDVVFLNRHGVRTARRARRLQRSAKVAHAVGGRIVRIVRKRFEHRDADQVLPTGPGKVQILLVDVDDVEFRVEDQIAMWNRVEHSVAKNFGLQIS